MPRRKTMEEVKKDFFKQVGNDYEILTEKYINNKTKLSVKHHACGNIIQVTADMFLNKKQSRCKYCASAKSWAYTNEEFQDMVSKSLDGDQYTVIGDYKNTHTKIKFQHDICGEIFEMRPNNFLIKGNRCPVCTSSKGEDAIRRWLNKYKFDFEMQVKPINGRQLSFDFQVNNVFIEFDGRFHFEPYSSKPEHIKKYLSQKSNDTDKNLWCDENNIKLVRISYKDNIENILKETFNDYRKQN